MDFGKYNFVYNAEAHFKGIDKYPEGVMEATQQPGTAGFNALCWLMAEMSVQGELIRRDMGYDPGEVLTEKQLKTHLKITELGEVRKIVLETMVRGLRGEEKEDEVIDEVLAEIEKKTGND